MTEFLPNACPDCATPEHQKGMERRAFIRVMGGTAGLLGTAPLLAGSKSFAADKKEENTTKPAEDLIRELYGTLSEDQKQQLVLPWDHGAESGVPSRLQTFNRPFSNKTIGENYTPAQQELVKRTLKAILSNEEAYERITRHGRWDGSHSFEGNGAVIFGDPTGQEKFSWMFAGHHLTLRCDGNSEAGAAFGGPMYYGHSANGYSDQNVYNYQTKRVQSVFDGLDDSQRDKAIVVGNPGDRQAGYKFRPANQPHPGIACSDLSDDQKKQVQEVMRMLLDPFRKEDGDEVMELVKANGGLEEIHLAFYKDEATAPNERWHFWRLEGPGFIWNYRVLPHVHCYVNIVRNA